MNFEQLPTDIQAIILRYTREMNELLEFERFLRIIFANLCYN